MRKKTPAQTRAEMRYRARQRKRKMVRVSLWVPEGTQPRLHKLAAELRHLFTQDADQ